MTIISEFFIPYSESGDLGVLLPKGRFTASTVLTILLGENGTRKSLILRKLLDDTFARQRKSELPKFPTSKEESDEHTGYYNFPNKLIAISAAPTDRFPSKPQPGEIGSRYDLPFYRYLGPRTARNIVSRNQSIFEFLMGILESPDKILQNARFIKKMAVKTGMPSELIFLVDTASFTSETSFSVDDLLSSKYPRIAGWIVERLKIAEFRHKLESAFQELSKKLHSRDPAYIEPGRSRPCPFAIKYDLESTSIDTYGVSAEALYWGLMVGKLRVRGLDLTGVGSKSINIPSAGQWNLFSSLVSLSLVAEDQSLVLIDEPENTLHPRWQREYLDDVLSGLENYKGCQVIIATHSPLLASSLRRGRDHLVRLVKRANNVYGELIDTPDGWTANDVLEGAFELPTTRSIELATLVDNALGLIAKGAKSNQQALKTISVKLMRYLDLLPEGDVARTIIQSILNVSDAFSAKNELPNGAQKK